MSSSPQPQIPRRRNGRTQACEPCRRRKVSCGHEVPVCVRCRRRNTESECVYVVDGRAMKFGPAAEGPATPTATVAATRLETLAEAAGCEPTIAEHRTASMPIISPASSHVDDRRVESAASPPVPNRNAGFLGPTSFSAVYFEAESSLASFQGQGTHVPSGGSSTHPTTTHRSHTPRETHRPSPALPPTTDSHLLRDAIATLELIPDRETGIALFRRHINPFDGWNRKAAERILFTLYDALNSMSMQELAQLLMRNGQTPLNENIDDMNEWIASFTGSNLRWESLGIVFCYWAFGSFNYRGPKDTHDNLNGLWQDGLRRRSRVAKFKEGAAACLKLADPLRNVNMLMVYLQFRHCILESTISGDASLTLARLQAEVASTAMFVGMHAESPAAPYTPTAASEARRRCFNAIYVIDKVTATFTGRPPMLSRTYTSTPLPLDIPNHVFEEGPEAVAAAMAKLDAEGWSTDNKIHSTTMLRARAALAYIRDAILEVALGSNQNPSIEHLLHLRNLELDAIAKFPPVLAYDASDIDRLLSQHDEIDLNELGSIAPPQVGVDGAAFYAKVLVRLEHLQNMFFLERLLAQRRAPNYRTLDLLSISVDMVALTLIFWTHKNRLYAMHGDFEWLVMSYAAPAGGVLCMELMNPTPPVADAGGGGGAAAGWADQVQPGDPRLSRSTIIQNLSLLVGFLGWVSPAAPNADLCQTVKGIIQRVLDYTLNNPAGPPAAGQPVDLAGAGLAGIDSNDPFFSFDLMDTFNWLRPDMGYDAMQTA